MIARVLDPAGLPGRVSSYLLIAALIGLLPQHSQAQDGPTPAPTVAKVYTLSAIQIAVQSDALPTLDWSRVTVRLMRARNGGYAPAPGVESKAAFDMPLSRVGVPMTKATQLDLQGSAIRAISRAIVQAYNDAGYGGVLVELAAGQIDKTGNDIRDGGNTTLVLEVRALTIVQVQTRAAGDRFKDEPTNHPAHQSVIDNSPVQAGDALKTGEIERYTRFLSRHPGRRVDAAVGEADQPDALALNYIVQENKPWTVFASISNTGTEQTSTWREQFGFTHYQLTGHDDVLSISYSTAGFEDTHAVSASYELPLFCPRVRGRVFASYSEFVASDVGLTGGNFSGKSHSVGGEVAWNFFQAGDWFADIFGGAQYQDVQIDNELFMPTLEGREQFFRPTAGVRTQRVTETNSVFGSLAFDWNADDIAGTSASSASELGRLAVDAEWLVMMFSASGSVYLEPLINRAKWEDLTTPGSTLAHELTGSVRGQYVFNNHRAIPQAQMTAGGFYSVRGYDESTAVGDNAVLVSVEYRFHLPRTFTPQPEPTQLFGQDFRVAPPSPRGRPDWDLILKTFVDYAHTSNNSAQLGENYNDLLGVGVGAEVQFKRYFTVRVDWGIALLDAEEVREGDNRFHMAATLVY